MPRPIKEGLDYFELDCRLNDKVKLIQAEFGLKGFAVIVKLFQKIYGERGYYCEWNEDTLFLFMSDNGLSSDSKNLIAEIVNACIRRDIFSAELYGKYQILTSPGIQKRYINAISKRVNAKLEKEYLLIDVDEKLVSSGKNPVSDVRNSINDVRNSQSRVDKIRVDNSSNKASAAPPPDTDTLISEKGFSQELSQAVQEWAAYKKEKRQGYKTTGFRNLLSKISNEAREHGEAAVIGTIRESMSSNYQGIVWDKIDGGRRQATTRSSFQNFEPSGTDYDAIARKRAIERMSRIGGAENRKEAGDDNT